MKELKIKIWNIENVVLMKVLQQDESLRNERLIFESKNDFCIQSYDEPDIFEDGIHIQGLYKYADNKIACYSFPSVEDAEEYVMHIKDMLKEYNESIIGGLGIEELKELKKELNKEIDKLQARAQEVSDKIEENIEKAKEIEQPGRVLEEIYYYVSGDATLQRKDIDSVFDNENYEIGNYFKTRGEAEKVLEKIKIYTKLKRFAEENNTEEIDWDNSSQSKHYIYYTYGMKEILISNVTNLKSIGTIFFTSRELAEQAIKKIGDENIKKLFD